MNNIIILDFESGEVHVFSYDTNQYHDVSDFFESLKEQGYYFSQNSCEYMITGKKITIH